MAKKLTIVVDAEDLASGKVKALSATMTGAVDKSEKKSKGFMSKIGGAMGKYQMVAGLAGGATVAFAAKLVNMASSADEVANKFNVVFKGVENVQGRIQALSRESGYAISSLQEMSSNLGDLIKPAGFAADNAYALSERIVQLSLDLGSFNNLRPQDVVRDFQSALAGSSETLQKYGIDVKETAIAQEALNMGLIDNVKEYAKLNPEEKRRIRTLALISKATHDSTDAIGDLARTQNSYSNQVRILNESLKELGEQAGRLFVPLLSKYFGAVAKEFRTTNEIIAKIKGTYVQSRNEILNADAKSLAKLRDLLEQNKISEEKMNKPSRKRLEDLRTRYDLEVLSVSVLDQAIAKNATLLEQEKQKTDLKAIAQQASSFEVNYKKVQYDYEKEIAALDREKATREQSNLDILSANVDLVGGIRDSKLAIEQSAFLTSASEKQIADDSARAKDNFMQVSTYAEYTKFNLQAAGNTLAQIISMTRRKGGLKFSGILKIGGMIASLIPGGQAIGAGLGTASNIMGAAGYQHGGSFIVPGSGDTDQPFMIPLTPGERVDVTPKGDTITNNNNTNNANINIGINANKVDENFVRIDLVPVLRKVLKDYNISL